MNQNHFSGLPKSPSGFTLVEMAIVLMIFGFLIGGLLLPISAQVEIRSRQETRKTMDSIKEALIGFALTNGRLPCPDVDGNGREDRVTGVAWNTVISAAEIRRATEACADATPAALYQGWIPFVTIGVGRQDDWNDRFIYRVSPEFSDTFNVYTDADASGNLDAGELAVAPLRTNVSLNSMGDIYVHDRGDDPATGGVETKADVLLAGTAAPSINNPAAIIISHGKNRRSAIDALTLINLAAAPANSDELLNANNGVEKVSRTPTPTMAVCNDTNEASNFCEFDDLVDWIAPSVLLSRMVQAGQLP